MAARPRPAEEPTDVEQVLERLRAEADPEVRAQMGPRYGIHTELALGVPMARMKVLAKGLGTDHALAEGLWARGWYEARVVASLVDDPAAVTDEQLDRWCDDFDNWAIVDTVCFNLFDRAPGRWAAVERWAGRDEEMVRRAAFALLWALALHDRAADDSSFGRGLQLVEAHATDDRPLVEKAIAMALKAVGKRRPSMVPAVLDVAGRLATSDAGPARRIGRQTAKELGGR